MATFPIDTPQEASAFGIGYIFVNVPGPQGPPGPAPVMLIGNVTQGITAAASITPAGTGTYELNLQLPQGNKGDQGNPGQNANMAIGTVTTLTPGSAATASITGSAPNFTLNLGIPRGNVGATGDPGRGTIIFSGNGPPSSGVGITGDYYVDNVGRNWWGPRATSGWPSSPAFSLVAAP